MPAFGAEAYARLWTVGGLPDTLTQESPRAVGFLWNATYSVQLAAAREAEAGEGNAEGCEGGGFGHAVPTVSSSMAPIYVVGWFAMTAETYENPMIASTDVKTIVPARPMGREVTAQSRASTRRSP
jgi:hypothetical protein